MAIHARAFHQHGFPHVGPAWIAVVVDRAADLAGGARAVVPFQAKAFAHVCGIAGGDQPTTSAGAARAIQHVPLVVSHHDLFRLWQEHTASRDAI
ncbi:hypothetical protein D3C85_1532270 [compost metagenome]